MYSIVTADEIRALSVVPRITGEEYDTRREEFVKQQTMFHLTALEVILKDNAFLSGNFIRYCEKDHKKKSQQCEAWCGRIDHVELHSTSYIVDGANFGKEIQEFFRGYNLYDRQGIFNNICDNIVDTLRAAKYTVSSHKLLLQTGKHCKGSVYIKIDWKTPTFGNCNGIQVSLD